MIMNSMKNLNLRKKQLRKNFYSVFFITIKFQIYKVTRSGNAITSSLYLLLHYLFIFQLIKMFLKELLKDKLSK